MQQPDDPTQLGTFEDTRTVTLLSGKVQARVAVVISAENARLELQKPVAAPGQDGMLLAFFVSRVEKDTAPSFAVKVTVDLLAPRGPSTAGNAWQILEGRWLGAIDDPQESGAGTYSCKVPWNARSGAACELYLVLTSTGGTMGAAPALRIAFSP